MTSRPIWLLWAQGWATAPDLVKLCLATWQRHNPGREVVPLDLDGLLEMTSLHELVDLSRGDLPVQKVAALGRLELLAAHGGVWADATVACTRPVDTWLPTPDGDERTAFFAFKDPGPDRLMANWFIAADRRSVILQRLRSRFLAVFTENVFRNQGTAFGERVLAWLEPRLARDLQSTLWADSWLVRRGLGVHPYFIFHYTFNRLVLEDVECRILWDRVPYRSANAPHSLQREARQGGTPSTAASLVGDGDTPVHKLDWRLDVDDPYWRTALQRLKEHA